MSKTSDRIDAHFARYRIASASLIAVLSEDNDTPIVPGVALAQTDHHSLVRLLVSLGIITAEQWAEAAADGMEATVKLQAKAIADAAEPK